MSEYFDPDKENYISTLRSSNASYRLYYHLVWGTKNRKAILNKEIGSRLIQIVAEICETEKCQLLGIHIEPEHVHVLISLRPDNNVASMVKGIKGKTSRMLRLEFPELLRIVDEKSLWADGYFACTVGDANVAQIKVYLDKQRDHHHR